MGMNQELDVHVPAGWVLTALAGGTLIVAYPLLDGMIQGAAFLGTVFLGVGSVIAAVRRATARRRAWWTLAAAAVFMALGEALWTTQELVLGTIPFPSPADAGYLAGTATLTVALLLLGWQPGRARRVETLLDVGVLTVAGGLLLWVVVIDRVLRSSELGPLATAIAAASPLLDVGLVAVLVALLLVPRDRRPVLVLFAAAGAAATIGDSLYALEVIGVRTAATELAPLGWMGTYVLLAVGAQHPSAATLGADRSPVDVLPPPRRILWLWAVAVAATAAVVTPTLLPDATAWSGDSRRDLVAALVAAVIMGTLVVARSAVTATALAHTLTERRQLERQLIHQAEHDALTGLANRRRFAEQAAVRAGRPGTGVIFLDLDGFKDINDEHGHAAGDELLRIVAARLEGALRGGALLARLGGDEFAVLLDETDQRSAEVVADRLVAAIAEPIGLGGTVGQVRVGASVGVAIASADDPAGRDLVHDADIAMYAVKRRGSDQSAAATS